MTLPSTPDLARRLYEAWRTRQDFVHPVSVPVYREYVAIGGRRRPHWEHLDASDQGVWLDVASEAGMVLRDALAAQAVA